MAIYNNSVGSKTETNIITSPDCEGTALPGSKVLNIKKEKCLLSGKVIPYVMNYDTIYEIDSPFDLKIVENLMNKR